MKKITDLITSAIWKSTSPVMKDFKINNKGKQSKNAKRRLKGDKKPEDWITKANRLIKLANFRTEISRTTSVPASTALLQDASGSMATDFIYKSMRANLSKINPDIPAQVFGYQERIDPRNSKVRTVKDLIGPLFFGRPKDPRRGDETLINSRTFTAGIEGAIEYFNKTIKTKYHLVLCCDGEFDDLNLPVILTGMRNSGDLNKVASLLIFFPQFVKYSTINKIRQSMVKFVKVLSGRHVPVKILEPAETGSVLVKEINKLTDKVPSIPEGHQGFSTFCWLNNATPSSLAKTLDDKPEIVSQLIDAILNMAKTSPTILTAGVYAKVHATLKLLKRQGLGDGTVRSKYLDVLSVIIERSEDRESLREMINDSLKASQNKKLLQVLKLVSINQMSFKTEISEIDVTSALRDGSGIRMYHLIIKIFKSEIDFTAKKGMCVPVKARCDKIEGFSYIKACKLTWQNFLSCIGFVKNQISGKVLFRVLLQILATPTMEVPKILIKMAEILLLDFDFVKKMLGVKEDSVIIDAMWYVPDMAQLLHHFFSLYKEDVAKDPILVTIASYFKKVNEIVRMKLSIINLNKKITRMVPDNLDLKIGSIVSIRIWPGDPWKALPSVAVVIGVQKKHGKIIRARLLYLDEPFSEKMKTWAITNVGKHKYHNVGHDTCTLPIKNFRVLCQGTEELKEILSKQLIVWKYGADNDNNKPNHNLVTRRKRVKAVIKIANEHSKLVPTTVEVPKKIITKIATDRHPHLRELLTISPLESKLRKEHFDAVIAAWEKLGKVISDSEYRVESKLLTKVEINDIWTTYQRLLKPAKAGPSQNSAECVICFESYRKDKRIHNQCNHAMCKKCHSEMIISIEKQIKKGQIPINLCFCPICRVGSILPKVEKWSKLNQFLTTKIDPKGIYRQYRCKNIFMAGTDDCAGSEMEMPVDCEDCRKPLYFKCPKCGQGYQHAGGCRMIRCCHLGYHGCPVDRDAYCDHGMGCGHVFSITEDEALLG